MINKKIKITAVRILGSGLVFGMPVAAFAQVNPTYVSESLEVLANVVDTAIPIVITLALLLFLWGLLKFMTAAGDETAQATGKKLMIWGIIILFVMVSVWGLVQLMNTLTGIEQTGNVGDAPDPVE
jgi:hypothetical protein